MITCRAGEGLAVFTSMSLNRDMITLMMSSQDQMVISEHSFCVRRIKRKEGQVVLQHDCIIYGNAVEIDSKVVEAQKVQWSF